MGKIIKPGQDRFDELENQIRGLLTAINQLSGIVSIIDKYMVLNKQFFDQIKLNAPEPKKEEPKKDK